MPYRAYGRMLGAMVARDAYKGVKSSLRRRFTRKRRPVRRRTYLRGRKRGGSSLVRRVRNVVAADKATLIHPVDFLNGNINRNNLYETRLDIIPKGTEVGGNENRRDGWSIDLRGFKLEYYLRNTEGTTHTTDVRMLIVADYTDYNDEIPPEERFFEGSGDGNFAGEALDFGSAGIMLHQKLNRKINGRR